MKPLLYLFDDALARDWQPFALTRPAGELLFGMRTLRERAELMTGLSCAGYLTAPHLTGFDEPGAPTVVEAADLPRDRALVLLSSRAVLSAPLNTGDSPATLVANGEVAGWLLPAGRATDVDVLEPAALPGAPERSVEAAMLTNVWDLISGNAEQTARDIAALPPSGESRVPDGVYTLGDERLVIADDVQIEPGTVLDLRHGPINLSSGVSIRAFTRLAGPAHIGLGCTLLGGPYDAISTGPVCKLHGEIEEAVILAYSNKAHDGFLGHAYLGRWVNLGAMTTNSDLKNNYGPVRLWTPRGQVNTGEMKLGCLLGDHVKTGIGTTINTGTVVGAGSNIFGGQMPPKYVPPFSWGAGDSLGAYDADKFIATAEVAMSRRDQPLSPAQRALLQRAWKLERES